MKKKILNTGLKAFVCVTLVGASAALPLDAANNIKGYANTIMETDTPAEYAQEFAEELEFGGEGGTVLEEVYLTDSQLAPMVEMAKAAYQEYFGVTVPKDMVMGSFAYMDEDQILRISFDWSYFTETFDPVKDTIWYSANFSWQDIENSTPKLTFMHCRNGFDRTLITNYEKMAVEGFKNQLDVTIPSNYTVYEAVLYQNFTPEYAGTVVELFWKDPVAEKDAAEMRIGEEATRITDEYGDSYLKLTTYQANFENINLKDGTGKLVGLGKQDHYANLFNIYDKELKANARPVFTDEQRAFMLEAVKNFAQEKNFEMGELRLESPMNMGGTKAMDFIFHAEGLNGTTMPDISFIVTEEGKVIGYFY